MSPTMLQPNKGPAETLGAADGAGVIRRFNPTRVLLKPRSSSSGITRVTLQPNKGPAETQQSIRYSLAELSLQPNKGPAETLDGTSVNASLYGLQPNKGPAETMAPSTIRTSLTRFNPTRVLLKPRRRKLPWSSTRTLQPNKGPAETPCRMGGDC